MSAAATTWGIGDYPRMGVRLMPAAEKVVVLADIDPGERVLDVGCGTGSGALFAATMGASVVGVDLEPVLLEGARERAVANELAAEWIVGDAAALPLPDSAFDAVLSVFGVMYAPDQEAAARELARVCAPGGRVVLAAWTPGSFMPAMGAALAPYLPPPAPAGGGPPSRWGDEDELRALLAAAGIELEQATRESLALEFAHRAEAVGFLVRTAGHVLAERERLTAEGRWNALLADLAGLVHGEAEEGDGGVSLRLDYLLARGRPL